MRVVAGEFKGRRLHAPRGARTRPTADRVREALFSMLADVTGARVLDLYAGSGALGIEALSRGAESAVFVENDGVRSRRCTGISRRWASDAEVRRQDVLRFLAQGRRAYMTSFSATPHMMMRRASPPRSPRRCRRCSRRDARIVTESDKRKPLILPLPLVVERSYGDTRIAIHSAT